MKFNIFNSIKRYSKWKQVSVFLILNIIIQRILTLSMAEKFKVYSGGLDALDMKVGYDVAYAKKLLFETPMEGHQYYLSNFFALDLIFPLVYSISYALLLSFLFTKAFHQESKLQKLVILPFIGGGIDYLENFGILLMISILPDFSPMLALTTSIFSIMKWIVASIGMILTVFGIVMWIVKLAKNRFDKSRKDRSCV